MEQQYHALQNILGTKIYDFMQNANVYLQNFKLILG